MLSRSTIAFSLLLLLLTPTCLALPSTNPTDAVRYGTDVSRIATGMGFAMGDAAVNVTRATGFGAAYSIIAVASYADPVRDGIGDALFAIINCGTVEPIEEIPTCVTGESSRPEEIAGLTTAYSEASRAELIRYATSAHANLEAARPLVVSHTTNGSDAIVSRTLEYLSLP